MSKPAFVAVTILLTVCSINAAEGPPGWELVWSDEFDGRALDPSKWEFEVNAARRRQQRTAILHHQQHPRSRWPALHEARKERTTDPKARVITLPARIRTRFKVSRPSRTRVLLVM